MQSQIKTPPDTNHVTFQRRGQWKEGGGWREKARGGGDTDYRSTECKQ